MDGSLKLKIELDGEQEGAWATYWAPKHFWQRPRIVLHKPEKEDEVTTYAKTIFGIDHEYLHHVLFKIEGMPACRGLDKIVGPPSDLTRHCIFTGFYNFQIFENGVEVYNSIPKVTE